MARYSLEAALGGILGGRQKPKRKTDSDYGRFRRLAKKHGFVYEIAPDGYIDIGKPGEKMISFPHYHWGESISRLEAVIRGESPNE